jgi:hypothetical protein
VSPQRNALLAIAIILSAPLGTALGSEFNAWWHDGKAELDGYRYTVTRYGQSRRGQAVAVYVTEPFSRSKNVKVDDASRNPRDTFDALKLNLVRDFQTGIYDYNTMTSLFVRRADFEPVKASFVSTEWCGNVYEELSIQPGLVSQRVSSYFENESAAREERRPKGGMLEEELFVRLRGLNGDYLRAGESATVPMLASAFKRRLTHAPLAWTDARIERLAAPREISVPAGRFRVMVYTVSTGNGHEGLFLVESTYPHRIVRWEWKQATRQKEASGRSLRVRDVDVKVRPEGNDAGELLGSQRLEYWKLHGEGDERYLAKLGLKPIPK